MSAASNNGKMFSVKTMTINLYVLSQSSLVELSPDIKPLSSRRAGLQKTGKKIALDKENRVEISISQPDTFAQRHPLLTPGLITTIAIAVVRKRICRRITL
jgi:hypothetical protein